MDDKRLKAVEAEIAYTIRQRAPHWQKLQDRVVSVVSEYETSEALYGAIYRIYSRADKQKATQQANPHMKSARKIAEEICLRRHGGFKIRNGKPLEIEPDPTFGIGNITDVVGVTIVCPFPSDVARVVAHVMADDRLGKRGALKVHDRDDYAATHLQVRFVDDPLDGLACELQVKTAFQDAFGWKVHDLSYKAETNTDDWLIDQLNKINVVIRAADEMSDQLRVRIARENAYGLARRRLAKDSLKRNILDSVRKDSDEARKAAISDVLERLDRALEGGGAKRGELFTTLREDIQQLIARLGYSATTFRVAALYAIDCGRTDQMWWLDEHHLAWTRNLHPETRPEDLEPFCRAAITCGIGHYCAGDLPGAILVGDKALERVRSIENVLVGHLATNVAYYYAERFGQGGKVEDAEKAKELTAWAKSILTEEQGALLKDTIGYVLIETGETVEMVEEGLRLCRDAYGDIQSNGQDGLKPPSQKFFELHREIAYRRLADLTLSPEESLKK